MVPFTKRQWLTLIVIGVADFCNAICVSLQAPFYPQEVSLIQEFSRNYSFTYMYIFIIYVYLP